MLQVICWIALCRLWLSTCLSDIRCMAQVTSDLLHLTQTKKLDGSNPDTLDPVKYSGTESKQRALHSSHLFAKIRKNSFLASIQLVYMHLVKSLLEIAVWTKLLHNASNARSRDDTAVILVRAVITLGWA